MGCLRLLLPDWTRCVASETVASGVLSRWCARADQIDAAPAGLAVAIREVFQFIGSCLPAAALTRQIDRGDAAGSAWLRADPAHVRADMVTARMLACGEVGLSGDESADLAKDLMPLFGDAGFELDARLPNRWYLRTAVGSQLPTSSPPDEVMGDDLKLHLPQGAAGKRWRQLFNESQIILHNHPVNAQRAQRGAVSVNSLWFWGAGVLPDWVRCDINRAFSDSLEVHALASIAGVRVDGLDPAIFEDTLSRVVKEDFLLDLSAFRHETLESWLLQIDHALQRRRLTCVDLLFASGQRFQLKPMHRLRFWRRVSELRAR